MEMLPSLLLNKKVEEEGRTESYKIFTLFKTLTLNLVINITKLLVYYQIYNNSSKCIYWSIKL